MFPCGETKAFKYNYENVFLLVLLFIIKLRFPKGKKYHIISSNELFYAGEAEENLPSGAPGARPFVAGRHFLWGEWLRHGFCGHSHELLLQVSLFSLVYPNNSRDVYLYIYWVSAYMG